MLQSGNGLLSNPDQLVWQFRGSVLARQRRRNFSETHFQVNLLPRLNKATHLEIGSCQERGLVSGVYATGCYQRESQRPDHLSFMSSV
jgi:hypothetical protein